MAQGEVVRLLTETICKVLGISKQKLMSESRHKRNVEGRKIFSSIIKKIIPEITYTKIGIHLNRNHATILSLRDKHNWEYKYIFEYAKLYDRCYNLFMDRYVKVDVTEDIEIRLTKYDQRHEKKNE